MQWTIRSEYWAHAALPHTQKNTRGGRRWNNKWNEYSYWVLVYRYNGLKSAGSGILTTYSWGGKKSQHLLKEKVEKSRAVTEFFLSEIKQSYRSSNTEENNWMGFQNKHLLGGEKNFSTHMFSPANCGITTMYVSRTSVAIESTSKFYMRIRR